VHKSRLEAFSDGVIAILITIMVFDIKPPPGPNAAALLSVLPAILTYLLSFLYLGIYWNNHHHLLQITRRVNGAVLWANLHLLFWLSLFPFTTSWLYTSHFSNLSACVYGVVLLLAAIGYLILQTTIIRADGPDSKLHQAIGGDFKGKLSPVIYVLGIAASRFSAGLSIGLYSVVALLWLIPDRRIESTIHQTAQPMDAN
jgi:uncharacterized membrane protein